MLGATTLSVIARGSLHDWISGDTRKLIAGLPAVSHCLTDGVLSNCNAHLPQRPVSPFPLLQMVPGYLLHLLGMPTNTLLGSFTLLNALVTVALCAAVIGRFHRGGGDRAAVLAGLLLIPGMLIAYTADTFGEPLAAAAFGGLCLAALRADRTSRWLLPLVFAATVSKDTAAPFVLLLAMAAIVLSRAPRAVARRSFLTTLLGIGLGLVAGTAFNIFRYGSLTNTEYLQFPSSRPLMVVNNVAGLLVSPNGGLAWFWPGMLAAAVVLAVGLSSGWGGRDAGRVRIAAALALTSFVGSILVLADWWQPYGWYAWGPRLLLPIGPAIIVIALAVTDRQHLDRWFTPAAATATALVAVLVLAPSIGIAFHPRAFIDQITDTLARYPECTNRPRARVPTEVWERCLSRDAWSTAQMPLLHAVTSADHGRVWYLCTLLAGALSVLLWTVIGFRSPAGSPVEADPADPVTGPDGAPADQPVAVSSSEIPHGEP